jgi:hypothetical protein
MATCLHEAFIQAEDEEDNQALKDALFSLLEEDNTEII